MRYTQRNQEWISVFDLRRSAERGESMKHRVVDLLLIVAFLVGGVWAWTSGRERGRLQADHDRLIGKMGDLPIGDPTLLHVLASRAIRN